MSDELRDVFKNEVIRASAGTGKTFALSNRFLRLLASGADCSTILATTFTRKGAGEILDRIVQRLAVAATSEVAAAELAGHLKWKGLDQTRVRQLLRDLLQNMHRLQIGTLDAFFHRIAQSFRLELSLPTEWSIVSEQQIAQLQSQVIRDILRKQSVIDLLHLITGGDAGRRVADLIRVTVDQLYDISRESDARAWNRLPEVETFNASRNFDTVEEQIQSITFPHKSQKKTVDAELALLQQGEWLQLARSSVFKAIANGTNSYYKPIPDDCIAAYQPIIEHCRGYLIDMLTRNNRSTRSLLEEFGTSLESAKKENGDLRFEDVTHELVDFIASKDTDHFSFRLDHAVDHLLLDEFQDTSIEQWKVIKPFALRTTENDAQKSFFCVGDLKQAIFGWRGGVAEIFDLVESDLANMSEAQQLTMSYRSAPAVIDFVNQTFLNLDRYRSKDGVVNSAVAAWASRFASHSTAKNELPGYCTLEYAADSTDKKDNTRNENLLVSTVDRVRKLHEEMPDKSIGVLVRTNETIGQLIFMLRDAGIPASEEGGNPLTDSAAVETVLSAMTLADHDRDGVARFHLSYSPLAGLLGLQPEDTGNQSTNSSAAILAAKQLRHNLSSSGYGPTIETLAQQLAPNLTVRELARLQQLVQQAFTYDIDYNEVEIKLRPQRFVRHIRSEFKASDESSARIRVMTVHQSKGLEFDIVVLPMRSSTRGWFVQNSRVIVGRESPVSPINLVCRLVNEDHRSLLPPEFQDAYDQNRRREVFDNLCVLYVAMTRAVHATHVVMSFGCKPESQSGAGILLSALVPDWKKEQRAEGVILEIGDESWHKKSPMENSSDATQELSKFYLPAESQLAKVSLSGSVISGRGISRVSPSGLEGGDSLLLSSIFDSLTNSTQLQRGIFIHSCFEEVIWLEEPVPDHTVLATKLRRTGASAEDAEQILTDFDAQLKHPAMVQLLTRSSYLQSYRTNLAVSQTTDSTSLTAEVSNERSFAIKINGQLMQGTIDRLVLLFDNNKLVAADVIDYKSDLVDAASIDERVLYYSPQLRAYRQAVAQIYKLPVEQITARIVFVESGAIVDVQAKKDETASTRSAVEVKPELNPHISMDNAIPNKKPNKKKQMRLWGED